MNLFEGICGKVAPGLCRLSMNGGIAVKTRAGYRSYDPATRRLTNCDSFVLDVGEDFFFVVPVNRVKPGDIILAGGTPRCVIETGDDTITALNFENAAVETLLPERHLFMGNTYLYGKIVSLLGGGSAKGRKGAGRVMKYMMLSSLLKGGNERSGALLPFMLMGGANGDFMNELFDMGGNDDDDSDDAKKEA